jgi:hypothetical protein
MLYNSLVAALTISSGIVSTLYLSTKLDNTREYQFVPLFATCISVATNYVAKETPNFLYNLLANKTIVFTAVACLLTSSLFSSLRFLQAVIKLAAASEYPLQAMEEMREDNSEEESDVEENGADETSAEEIRAEETATEETATEETPAEETPTEETPAEETVAEETVAEETVAEETATEETVVESQTQ